MKNRIIYETVDGELAVIIPAECGLTIEEIAVKDVPKGRPYFIIDESLIPTDRSQRQAWTSDFTNAKVNE